MKLHRHCLLFICLFFIKGHDHAFAACCGHTSGISIVQTIQSQNSFEFDYNQDQDVLIQYALLSENDDDDIISTRKKALVSRFSALHAVSFLDDLSNPFHNNRRLHERFTYISHDRSIFQRVLRV